MSNRERGDIFAKRVGEYFAVQGYVLHPEYPVEVGLSSRYKKTHRFDYGNEVILVECKFYDWTIGGNNPSAKISTLNEAMMYFHAAPKTFQKILVLPRTEKKGMRQPETFEEYYVRLNKHFIPDDVEIWELDANTLSAQRIFLLTYPEG